MVRSCVLHEGVCPGGRARFFVVVSTQVSLKSELKRFLGPGQSLSSGLDSGLAEKRIETVIENLCPVSWWSLELKRVRLDNVLVPEPNVSTQVSLKSELKHQEQPGC